MRKRRAPRNLKSENRCIAQNEETPHLLAIAHLKHRPQPHCASIVPFQWCSSISTSVHGLLKALCSLRSSATSRPRQALSSYSHDRVTGSPTLAMSPESPSSLWRHCSSIPIRPPGSVATGLHTAEDGRQHAEAAALLRHLVDILVV